MIVVCLHSLSVDRTCARGGDSLLENHSFKLVDKNNTTMQRICTVVIVISAVARPRITTGSLLPAKAFFRFSL